MDDFHERHSALRQRLPPKFERWSKPLSNTIYMEKWYRLQYKRTFMLKLGEPCTKTEPHVLVREQKGPAVQIVHL